MSFRTAAERRCGPSPPARNAGGARAPRRSPRPPATHSAGPRSGAGAHLMAVRMRVGLGRPAPPRAAASQCASVTGGDQDRGNWQAAARLCSRGRSPHLDLEPGRPLDTHAAQRSAGLLRPAPLRRECPCSALPPRLPLARRALGPCGRLHADDRHPFCPAAVFIQCMGRRLPMSPLPPMDRGVM